MKIIGLGGHAKVGKTTFANWFTENRNATHLTFGGVLREVVSEEYCIPMSVLRNDKIKDEILEDFGVKPRELFIKKANEKREIDELFFAKQLESKMMSGEIYIISDFGFKSDVKYFREKYGDSFLLFWIERPLQLIFDNRDLVSSECDTVVYGREDCFDPDYILKQMIKYASDHTVTQPVKCIAPETKKEFI